MDRLRGCMAAGSALWPTVWGAGLLLADTLLLLLQVVCAVVSCLWSTLRPPAPREVRGEVAVVTGGGRGIGRCLALRLARLGARVAVWDLDTESAQTVVKELEVEGGSGLALEVDVSDREAVRRAALATRLQLGEVTLLFNNAGIMPCKPLLSHTEKEVEQVFRVNVFSQFWTIYEFLPRMLSINMGHIISMSSMAGVTGTPNLVPYCATKFALRGLMDALFLELRAGRPDSAVRLTTIHPFTVDTGLAKRPRSRFRSLFPFTSPEAAADAVLTATRSNHEYAYIPAFLCPLTVLVRLLPRAAQLAITDYLDCAVDPHDD